MPPPNAMLSTSQCNMRASLTLSIVLPNQHYDDQDRVMNICVRKNH